MRSARSRGLEGCGRATQRRARQGVAKGRGWVPGRGNPFLRPGSMSGKGSNRPGRRIKVVKEGYALPGWRARAQRGNSGHLTKS
jgi:hypothetical protein